MKETKKTIFTEEPAITEVVVTTEETTEETAATTEETTTTDETTITIVGGDNAWLWSGAHRGKEFGSDDPVTSLAIALEKAKAETRRIDQEHFAEFYAARNAAGDSADETTGL